MQLLLTLANMSSMLAVGRARYTLLQLMLKVPLRTIMGCISENHYQITGPVNNILIVRKEPCFNSWPISQASSRRCGSLLPSALAKYSNPIDEDADVKAIFDLHSTCGQSVNASYMSSHVINNQIKELKQQGSSASAEMEMKRLKLDCSGSLQTIQQWKKMYEDLHQFCLNELLDDDQVRISNGNST